jgi:hypothetical protein
MKQAAWLFAAWLAAGTPAFAAETSHAIRQGAQDLAFHYGIVPAAVVLAHPDQHPERAMHGGRPPKGASHVVLALFDAAGRRRVSDAQVTATVTPVGGASVSRKLEPMSIAGQPSFGGFFSFAAPGIYRIRFEARLPGAHGPAIAEFEHRVSPEGRRR